MAKLPVTGGGSYSSGLFGEVYAGATMRTLRDALREMDGSPDATFVASRLDYRSTDGSLSTMLGTQASTLSTASVGALTDQFALRLSGQIYLEAGTHRFSNRTDDGFRLTVDGNVIAEYADSRAAGTTEGTVQIATAGWYSINIDYFEAWGYSEMRIRHSVNGGSLTALDSSRLRHATDGDVVTPPPPPPPNTVPDARDDAVTLARNGQATFDPLANDVDADGDRLSITAVGTPSNGRVVQNTDGTLTYIPNANFSGTDSFTYRISDGRGGTDTARVNLTVTATNTAPDARNDSRTLAEDGRVTLDPLANDVDADGDTLTITSVGTPSNGRVVQNADGTLTYIPNANFNGTDSFTYSISDGRGGTDTARVNLTVTPVNDAPVAVDDSGFMVTAGQVLNINIADLLANDRDVDGDALTITRLSNVVNGTATIVGDQVRFVATAEGEASFRYTVSDGNGGTDTANVSIGVHAPSGGGTGGGGTGGGGTGGGGHGDGGHGGGHELIDPPQTPAEIAAFVAMVRAMPEHTMPGHDAAMRAMHTNALNLVSRADATHIAINHGDWHDASTWHNGRVPGDGARVLIPEGISVDYSSVNSASIFTVRVDGMLHFATDQDSRLEVDTLVVSPTGHLRIGTPGHPVDPDTNVDIVFANNGNINVTWDPALLSRGMIAMGEVDIAGVEKTSHLKVAVDAMRGDTRLTLEEVPTGWQVGDKLVLTGTYQQGFYWNNDTRRMDFMQSQDEEVTITAISGNVVTLNRPLTYNHDTPRDDLKAYVSNMTRNVTFSSEGGDSLPNHQRGHVMFMHNDNVDVRYAGFNDLGRTDKSLYVGAASDFGGVGNLTPRTNVEGRYSFHLHEAGVHDIMNPAIVIGNVVDGSPGWGFVQHSSNANLTSNVAFDVWGAAFVAEDGNETGTWYRNIAIKSQGWAAGDVAVKHSEVDGNDARTGDGFWFAGRLVEVAENVAANTTHGFVWMHRGDRDPVSPDTLHQSELGYGRDTLRPDTPPIQGFRDNEAFGTNTGIIVVKANADQGHDVRSVFDGFLNWETREGVAVSYTSHYTFLDFDLVGQRRESGPGWHDAYQGVNLGGGAFDMVFNGLRIDGFQYAINMMDSASILDHQPKDLGNIVIDGSYSNISIRNYAWHSSDQLEILRSSDLTPGRLDFRLTGDRFISDRDHMMFDGIKTDSIGATDRNVYAAERQGLWGWDKENFLNTNGYWRLPDGRAVALVEDYIADRATGELHKHMLVFDLDYSNSVLQSRYPYNGVINLGGPAAVARNDSATTTINTDVRMDLVANDYDPDGGRVYVNGLTNPLHGDVFMQDDGTVIYRPNQGFVGVDHFYYWAADEEGNFTRAEAVVTVQGGGSMLHHAMSHDMFDF